MTALKQFTPNWYTTTMGTGIMALMLNQLPFAGPELSVVARGLWLFNILLFAVLVAVSIGQFIFYRKASLATFTHPVQSMFYGCAPMGFATIVNGFTTFGPSLIGNGAYHVAYELWWIDAALAVTSGWLIPQLMFTKQEHSLEKATAVWLLPIVPAEVTAASGGQLAPHLSGHAAHLIVGTSAVLWSFSVPLALAILALVFLRLALHKVPPSEMGVSGWLTLGPLGTGALGSVLLGNAAVTAFQGTSLAPIALIAQGVGIIAGAVLWGYGMWWWISSTIITLQHAVRSLPFNLGWWGFTFPLGVFSAATMALGRATHAAILTDIGTGLILLLAMLWIMVATRTTIGLIRGEFFPSLRRANALVEGPEKAA